MTKDKRISELEALLSTMADKYYQAADGLAIAVEALEKIASCNNPKFNAGGLLDAQELAEQTLTKLRGTE